MTAHRAYRRPHCTERLHWRDARITEHRDEASMAAGPRLQSRAREVSSPATVGRYLTPEQLQAIAAIMRLFVDDDLANGVSALHRMQCDACVTVRPAPGFIRYERWQVCNDCATRYEILHARGLVPSIGAYLTDTQARRGA